MCIQINASTIFMNSNFILGLMPKMTKMSNCHSIMLTLHVLNIFLLEIIDRARSSHRTSRRLRSSHRVSDNTINCHQHFSWPRPVPENKESFTFTYSFYYLQSIFILSQKCFENIVVCVLPDSLWQLAFVHSKRLSAVLFAHRQYYRLSPWAK